MNMLGSPRTTLDFEFMIFENEFDVLAESINKIGYKQVLKTDLYARFQSKDENQLPYLDCLFTNEETYNKIAATGKKVDLFWC